jgi:predicted nucleotidyltransferase component of viral defense system
VIVTPPILTMIKHPYSDYAKKEMCILCYSFVEIFAEKIRALVERTRPRDLYDVINLFQHPDSAALAKKVCEVLQKKCEYKKISFPKYEDLMQREEACQSGWNIQLLHQLPALPAFELFWDKLATLFAWLNY